MRPLRSRKNAKTKVMATRKPYEKPGPALLMDFFTKVGDQVRVQSWCVWAAYHPQEADAGRGAADVWTGNGGACI